MTTYLRLCVDGDMKRVNTRGLSPARVPNPEARRVHFCPSRMQKTIDTQKEVVNIQRARVAEMEHELQRLRTLRDDTEKAIVNAQEELSIRSSFLDVSRDQLMHMLDTQAKNARAYLADKN